MKDDIFESIMEEAEDLSKIPTDEGIDTLRKRAMQTAERAKRISEIESQLSELKKKQYDDLHTHLPAYFNSIGSDRLGLSEVGVDMVLEPFAHASIPKDWDEDRRKRAFDYLESIDAGSLIKADLRIVAGKGDLDRMKIVLEIVNTVLSSETPSQMLSDLCELFNDSDEKFEGFGPVSADVTLGLNVMWNTLTSFVKEQHKNGVVLELDTIGATVGEIVKIKKRKD